MLTLPPTLPSSSPLANALATRRDYLGFFERLAREAGDFAHYSLGPDAGIYFVNDPALVREVLVRREELFRKWAFNPSFWHVLGQGVISSEDPLHRKLQRIEQPAFHQGRLPDYARLMVEGAVARQARWEEGDLEVSREFSAIVLEIVAQALFSVSLEDRLDAHLDAARDSLGLSGRFGASAAEDRAFLAANEHFIALSRELLERRRRDGHGDDDLLALLLNAQLRDGASLNDAQLIDEIRTFLIAGHATTANALASAFWLLSRDPGAEAELHRELDAALGGRTPTLADLPALGCCERVFLEALRLYPPVWAINREALVELPLGGVTLPAGARLVIVPWTLHRDPAIYPEPEKFLPARWDNDARARLPRGSYLPFSAGSRTCMGERFALLEGTLVLAAIAQRWRFESAPERPPLECTPQIVLWPRRGVWLRARRRGRPAAGGAAFPFASKS